MFFLSPLFEAESVGHCLTSDTAQESDVPGDEQVVAGVDDEDRGMTKSWE